MNSFEEKVEAKADVGNISQDQSSQLDCDRFKSDKALHSVGTSKTAGQDEALELLQFAAHTGASRIYTAEEGVQLLRKIDKHLMPIMFAIYFLQLMDKQTLAFSSVFGISRDANLTGADYSLLGSIVYIAQLVAQPASTYFIVRFRLCIYVPIIVTCWGATLACMTAATNFPGLLVSRFFLGVFEASIQAAFIMNTQIWYRRHEQGFRLAVWYSNNGWVNIFGSLIMYGIGHIKSKFLHPYQIVFLLLGSITFTTGIFSFWLFPDNPVRCKFLKTDEKVMAVERIHANQQGLETKQFKFSHVLEMLLDVKSWLWMVLQFLVSLPSSGIATFGPLILRGFGFNKYQVMLLMIPFGALQVIVLFTGFWANRRFGKKSLIILVCMVPCIAGTTLLLVIGRDKKDQPILLAAYYILSAYNVMTPTVMNWQSSNVAGHTKKSASNALMLAGLITGNLVGPLLFTPSEAPYYRRGIVSMLVCFCAATLLSFIAVAYLYYMNSAKTKKRIQNGKTGKMVDYSMLSVAEAEKRRQTDGDAHVGGSRAFEDLTDLQNDEFIYVY